MKGTYLFVTFLYFIPINTNSGEPAQYQGMLGSMGHPFSQMFIISKISRGFL